jgi:hypothetical protein
MIILPGKTSITVKDTVDSVNHVEIGVLRITFWVNGEARGITKIRRPHGEFTINDFKDLMQTLQDYENASTRV